MASCYDENCGWNSQDECSNPNIEMEHDCPEWQEEPSVEIRGNK